MVKATKINSRTFSINGKDISIDDLMKMPNRIHLANGDVEIYDSVSDMPKVAEQFDLEDYKQKVNDAHNALFRRLYSEKNYLSIGELSIWVNDTDFGEEANDLIDWWRVSCKTVAAYLDSVSESSAIPLEDFINSLL